MCHFNPIGVTAYLINLHISHGTRAQQHFGWIHLWLTVHDLDRRTQQMAQRER
ncbi:hypothetical protein D3C72_2209140 [compost metagenome]